MIALLVVEDDWFVRSGLELALSRAGDMTVAGVAETAAEALAVLAHTHADIALVDLGLPDVPGAELTRLIRSQHAATAVIVLTVSEKESDLVDAFAGGAAGYLIKREVGDPLVLYEVIRRVASGEAHFTQRDVDRVATRMRPALPETYGLAPTQLEVLRLIARGKSNEDIAKELHFSKQTVKNYARAIFQKLGVKNRTEAALFARDHGLADAENRGTA